jgi:hypothetical protein
MVDEVGEVDENRRILLAIAGVRIPGGCDDCLAHAVVHYGILSAAGDDVTEAPDLESGVFRLCVYHDDSCPFYAASTA